MSKKDDTLYLWHILETARKASDKVQGLDRATYNADENLRLALTHLVQVIGEEAARVSPAGQAAYPDIPWRQIVGMRHKIVHDYLYVDEDVVWQVVVRDLPTLITQLERILVDE